MPYPKDPVCGAVNGSHTCDREPEHDGDHHSRSRETRSGHRYWFQKVSSDLTARFYRRTEGTDDGRSVYRSVSSVGALTGIRFLRVELSSDAEFVCDALNAAEKANG